eukprot:scaffold62598_cov45-Phaeocystis_antarctica.AAC.3
MQTSPSCTARLQPYVLQAATLCRQTSPSSTARSLSRLKLDEAASPSALRARVVTEASPTGRARPLTWSRG